MADRKTMVEDEASAAPAAQPSVTEEPFALEGHKLDEMGGAQVGRIEGRVVGTGAGPEWLLARMGRFGHYCLVPSRDAVTANGRVWVPYTRDQIRRAPRFDPKATLDGELEQAVQAHYGLG
jgi:hypothetical protein